MVCVDCQGTDFLNRTLNCPQLVLIVLYFRVRVGRERRSRSFLYNGNVVPVVFFCILQLLTVILRGSHSAIKLIRLLPAFVHVNNNETLKQAPRMHHCQTTNQKIFWRGGTVPSSTRDGDTPSPDLTPSALGVPVSFHLQLEHCCSC